MKRIKPFALFNRVFKETKLFESNDFDLEEIEQIIKDLTLDLSDRGYNIKTNGFTGNNPIITIDRVGNKFSDPQSLLAGFGKNLWDNKEEKSAFMSDISGLISYLESEGFSVNCKVKDGITQYYMINLKRLS